MRTGHRTIAGGLALLLVTAPALAQEEPQKIGPPPELPDDAPRPAPQAESPTELQAHQPGANPAHDPNHDVPPLGLLPTGDALIDPRMARTWGALPARWFVSTMIDVGWIYTRPRISFGYGKPFTKWFGVDLNPLANGQGLGGYGGLRLELPFFDIRFGARYFSAFTRTYLPEQESYDRLSLETESTNAAAKVLTVESEIDVSVPAGPGNIVGRVSGSYVSNIPDHFTAYEETLRVIVKPPWVWRARGGYAFRFGKYQQHSLGVVVDFLNVPERDDFRTVRVGPIIRFVLSRRVDIRGSFVVTALSPDRIGLRGGDFTELGVRYRWATE